MSWLTPWLIGLLVSWSGKAFTLPSPLGDAPANVLGNSVVSVDLSIANRCVAPDGFPRVAVLAGKEGEEPTLPGPVISGYKGDRFLINVTNDLTDTTMLTGTTVHWHGIHQHHSSQMDGTAYVSQCPISPQRSFLYNFTGENQVGTFWYHSHYAVQYCDGLRGPLIIRDPEDPYKDLYEFDDDSTIITLMDWYHYPSVDTPRNIWPDSVLINGTGCYEPESGNCPPPATYTVEATKGYRFRLLNMSCKLFYNFTIDNHTMTVIEADGEYVEPYVVDSIQVYAGQRYSFVLNADQPVGNYWIRATPNPGQLMRINTTTTAILRYIDAPEVDPQTVSVTNNYLNETLLRSLSGPASRILEPNPDVSLTVALSKNDSNFNFLINDTQYISPSVPVLLQIMNGMQSREIGPKGSVYSLPRDKVVEIIFHVDNTPGRPHPFHLHGHHFAVMKSSDGEVLNYDRPVMRDTVGTGFNTTSDDVTIRFITDNPGPWILHCHNEWHLYAGMAIVFIEDYEGIPTDQPLSNATRDLCPYDNPSETWSLPPPRSTAGPYYPTTTSMCTPTPLLINGV